MKWEEIEYMITNKESSDAIDVLEALYDLEQPRTIWFRGVLKAAASAFDRGAGVGMVLYDVSEGVPRLEAKSSINVDAEQGGLLTGIHDDPARARVMVEAYRTEICATLDEHVRNPLQNKTLREQYARVGLMDQLLVNGANHSGFGCALYILSREHLSLSAAERAQMSRIATHLSTAYRLLRRLETPLAAEPGAVQAILKSDGQLEHAEPAASSGAVRRSLADAVKQREWARAPTERGNPERGTAAWKPLVAGRWSLVDRYEQNGSRYIVARENVPTSKGPEALSPREGQVAALAGLGRSNKLIAYELGLAHSTVRVLLARAAAKLGAKSRLEMIEQIRRRA